MQALKGGELVRQREDRPYKLLLSCSPMSLKGKAWALVISMFPEPSLIP